MGLSAPASNNAALDLAPQHAAALTGIRSMFRLTGGALSVSTIVLALTFFDDRGRGLSVAFECLARRGRRRDADRLDDPRRRARPRPLRMNAALDRLVSMRGVMPRFEADRLQRIGHALLVAAGTPPDEADIVMQHSIDANLAGHDSHGIIQIPTYIDRIKAGHIVPAAEFTVVQESPTTT